MSRTGTGLRAFLLAIGLLAPAVAGYAGSRPAIGARAPMPAARDLDGKLRSPNDFAGRRGVALLFWAAWSERSVEQLRRLDAAARELHARGVGVVAVNVERHGAGARDVAAIREHVRRLDLHLPVLIDDRFELFQAYGVVAVPSTALVDAAGRLTYFTYGYAHGQREDLFDALDRLAGIERPRPSMPQAEPAAIRRLQFGRVQLAQGRAEPARRSFESAAEADPTFADPLVELAALALDESDTAAAGALLDRAAAIDSRSAAVRRERARLQFLEGDGAAARAALEELAVRGADPIAAEYLRLIARGAGDASAAARAMAAVRREVAAGRL